MKRVNHLLSPKGLQTTPSLRGCGAPEAISKLVDCFVALRAPRNDGGFTLIEVLIAIVIIATGLVLIVEGMGRSQEAIGISQNLITASRLAEEKMTDIGLDVQQRHSPYPGMEKGTERDGGRVFGWTKQTAAYADPSIEDQSKMNQSEVTVKWKEGAHRENEVKVDTLFLKREEKE